MDTNRESAMAEHTPWREIGQRRGPDTPERQAARAASQRAMEKALRLAALREARGVQPSALRDPAPSTASETPRKTYPRFRANQALSIPFATGAAIRALALPPSTKATTQISGLL